MSAAKGGAPRIPPNTEVPEVSPEGEPMCTASALCIGIRGDTRPHSDGGQLALGSGNVDCADTPGPGPAQSHAATHEPAARQAIALLFELFMVCLLG